MQRYSSVCSVRQTRKCVAFASCQAGTLPAQHKMKNISTRLCSSFNCLASLWALETLGEIHGTAYGLKFKYMGPKCCSRYKLHKRS